MIRVCTWPDTKTAINPYLRLFYRALEPWQVEVAGKIPLDNAVLKQLRENVDVLHFHWGPDNLWRNRGGSYLRRLHGLIGLARLLSLARNLGMKIVWTIHDLESHDGSDFLDRYGYRLLASRADLCICHDEEACRQSIRRFGCRRERLLTMAPGNYDGVFGPPAERATTLRSLDLNPECPTLLCFGLARPYKGFELAIDATRELSPDYQLVIAGAALDADYGRLLQAMAAGEPRVRLVLRSLTDQELADFIHACDCVVLPYRRITGSGALLSALTLSRAVITSDLPFFRQSLSAEPDSAVFFSVGHPGDLARAVKEFFSLPLVTRTRAARRVADGLAWHKVVEPVGRWLQHALPDRLTPGTAVPSPTAANSYP